MNAYTGWNSGIGINFILYHSGKPCYNGQFVEWLFLRIILIIICKINKYNMQMYPNIFNEPLVSPEVALRKDCTIGICM